MNISTFDDLLQAARQQPDAQRLLLVFAGAGLPDDASPEQRAAFAAGHGGELTPVMCVDKTPEEIGTFETLCTEANQFGHDWAIVFVAGMSGKGRRAPSSDDAAPHLQSMVDAVKVGQIRNFIPFNRSGDAVQLG
ncbi:ribonucleotide reductase subunit alpha [Aquabacterium sp.]|uniref:ribonucleotide reductase subunit alpha n=1 Tax=Aquabacterium sp. TaxID=1872578 RepID=UPI003B718E89